MGYATIRLDKWNEDYLVPLPNVKVSGLLTGTPYPEITGTYSIVSSRGFVADIDFSGKKLLGLAGKKNSFTASVYDSNGGGKDDALYTAEGTWSEGFTIRDERSDAVVETYDYDTASLPRLQTEPLERQDPWESQQAWNDTTTALDKGDMQGAADAKSKIEEGQRAMRAEEEQRGETWKTIFFRNEREDPVYSKLAAGLNTGDDLSKEFGFWKYNFRGEVLPSKPYRGDLTPSNTTTSHGNTPAAVTEQSSRQPVPEDQEHDAQQFSVPRKPVSRAGAAANSQDLSPATTQQGTAKSEQPKKESNENPYSARALDPRVG
jgi:hypothetical protein